MNRDCYPTIAGDDLGWLTEEQMVEVDRIMIDDLRIELIQMMENAGRSLARLIVDLAAPTTVIVLAGSGGNGGGGLVAARHLANAGVDVTVGLTRQAAELTGVPGHQLDILHRMGVTISSDNEPDLALGYDVAVDALIGYSLRGAPRGRTAAMIEQIPRTAPTVVSLDTPSGLNVTTGEASGIAVLADATMTLALPKVGLRTAAEVGDLYLADISVPPFVMRTLGAQAPIFTESAILRISG
ncbi:MAG: NAD(P)H-hydrate epimerase [Acidimicrobiales bacterium]